MVEVRTSQIEAFAAQKSEPRRAAWNREADRERAMAFGHSTQPRGVHRDFIRYRSQRRQDARAADDDTGAGLAHDMERRSLLQVEVAGNLAAPLQIDQRVGQREILLPDVLVVALQVLAELAAAVSEIIRSAGPRGESDIHEVRRTAHHAARRARPIEHHHAARLQLLSAPRNDERQADALAAGRRDIGHLVAQLRVVLHVVKFRDRAHAALQPWMRRDVFDALAVQPDLSVLLPQAPDVLLSGSRWHSGSPNLRVWKTSRTHPGSHLVPAFTAELQKIEEAPRATDLMRGRVRVPRARETSEVHEVCSEQLLLAGPLLARQLV